MADSKIDFSFENLHFSCEGDNAWVEKQLNNVLSRIPALLAVHKKGENIIEEVIDVQEVPSRVARQKKAPKPPRTPKTPKVKTVKAAKAIKVPKEKAIKVPKEKAIKIPKEKPVKVPKAKPVRVPKEKPVKVPKVKSPKSPKAKETIGRTDSPLYQFLMEKKAEQNQVRKFLAAAVYLAKSNDHVKLSTPLISKALKSAGIEKLKNASDCLNKNEKKGYCIKEGKNFTITENGFLTVG